MNIDTYKFKTPAIKNKYIKMCKLVDVYNSAVKSVNKQLTDYSNRLFDVITEHDGPILEAYNKYSKLFRLQDDGRKYCAEYQEPDRDLLLQGILYNTRSYSMYVDSVVNDQSPDYSDLFGVRTRRNYKLNPEVFTYELVSILDVTRYEYDPEYKSDYQSELDEQMTRVQNLLSKLDSLQKFIDERNRQLDDLDKNLPMQKDDACTKLFICLDEQNLANNSVYSWFIGGVRNEMIKDLGGTILNNSIMTMLDNLAKSAIKIGSIFEDDKPKEPDWNLDVDDDDSDDDKIDDDFYRQYF